MTLTLKIAGVDKTNQVDWTSVSVDQNLTKTSDQMVFHIKNYGAKTYVPNLNDEVILTTGINTSYSNAGGTGNRQSIITITQAGSMFNGAVTGLINGVTTQDGTSTYFTTTPVTSSQYLTFDFGVGKIISEVTFWYNSGYEAGYWKWQGSNDNSTWTDVSSSTHVYSTSGNKVVFTLTSTTLYRYYRMIGVSGTTTYAGSSYANEFEFKITDQLPNTIFGGYIVSIKDDISGLAMTKEVTVKDYSYALDNILIAKTYTNTSAHDIIADIMSNAPAGFTYTGVVAPDIVSKIVFRYVSATECFKKLATYLINYDWYVDYNKNVNFFQIGTILAPFGLSDTSANYLFNTLEVTNDISQMANFIYIRGGMVSSSQTRTEYLSGDGTSTGFALANDFYSKPTVTVGGSAQTVGIDNVDLDASYQCMWNQDAQSLRFTSGNTPTAGTNNIVVLSLPRYPLIYQKQNQTSVALYGAKPKLITDKTITDIPTASRRADAELAQYGLPVGSATFTTDTAGLFVGQLISIVSTARSINQVYKIQSVHTYLKTPTALRYEVTCQVAGNVGINDILTLLLINNQTANDDPTINDTIQRIFAFSESLTITDTLHTPTTSSPPYKWGTMKWGLGSWHV